MRIGIDARELTGHPTGVGRHLAGLLREWATDPRAARHSFVLYSHDRIPDSLLAVAQRRLVPGRGGTSWEQIALPTSAKRDRLDVFFAPAYTAPLSLKTPVVVLVHDLSFVAHPEWFRFKEGLRRRVLTRWSSKRARLILAVSDTARNEIVARFRLAPDRVRRIYPGVTRIQHRLSSQREPLVLFVGSVFNRRHIPDLIRGFDAVRRRHPQSRLVIVGDNRTHPHQDLSATIAAERLQAHVTIRPYTFDDGLADLYGRARAFAFLSEYEGFGHPPLEALVAGVPSVLFDTPVAREVCGDAAVFVPCGDLDGISLALERLLFDEELRARVLNAGAAVLRRYSWKRAAEETLEALETAGG